MKLTFYGVRGSCPCPCEANRRYGGNTASVALEVEGEPPILFDLGTGLRLLAASQPHDGTFRGTALLTHIHWDHVQGLPFFPPVDRPGARLDVYGPAQEGGTLAEVFDDFMRPPYFPVQFSDLRGDIRFHDVLDDDFEVGSAKVKVRPVPHCGPTLGYRVDWQGVSIAYVSDHQAPLGLDTVADAVVELCEGVDLLIHDAQYTPEEFAEKSHWGHCTIDYAVLVARESGVRRLCLFHHDPAHSDDQMDRLLEGARRTGARLGVDEVTAAYEGMTLTF
ncbi:MAG TPA: MBL fold metallo-hydrolase [Acidimicrobiales bacterium]|nr:MBL fold metallo-hydrolase [Acidimicrobiales bacterium]